MNRTDLKEFGWCTVIGLCVAAFLYAFWAYFFVIPLDTEDPNNLQLAGAAATLIPNFASPKEPYIVSTIGSKEVWFKFNPKNGKVTPLPASPF